MPQNRLLLALFALATVAVVPAAEAQAPGFVPGKSKLSLSGLGDLKFGMTEEQFATATSISMEKSQIGDCTIYDAGRPGTPQGPFFRFQDGRLTVISVGRKGYRTPQNIGFRSSATNVRRKYKAAKSVPNVGGGSALQFIKGDRGYTFKIARSRVYEASAGLVPYVRQQECS